METHPCHVLVHEATRREALEVLEWVWSGEWLFFVSSCFFCPRLWVSSFLFFIHLRFCCKGMVLIFFSWLIDRLLPSPTRDMNAIQPPFTQYECQELSNLLRTGGKNISASNPSASLFLFTNSPSYIDANIGFL
jgi:hypothetical protein